MSSSVVSPNTNSGHPVLARDREVDIGVATNTVQHAPTTPSVVELPVLGHQETNARTRETHMLNRRRPYVTLGLVARFMVKA
jgi:hypothetical protein